MKLKAACVRSSRKFGAGTVWVSGSHRSLGNAQDSIFKAVFWRGKVRRSSTT